MTKKKPMTDAIEILHRRYVANDPEMQEALHEARANYRIAMAVVELRRGLGLTQRELAKFVGTSPSVIRRLEAADYEGPAATMLEKIAAAVKDRAELSIQFVATETTIGTIPTIAKKNKKSKAAITS